MTSIRRTTLAVTASTLLSLGVLSGCSAEDISNKVAEKVVEEGLGDGAEVDIDNGDGGVTVKDGDGNEYTSGSRLPKDFPEDEVPLIDGTILSGVSATNDGSRGWTVAITVDESPSEAFDQVKGQLEAAGFTSEQEVYAEASSGQWSDDRWVVTVLVFSQDEGSAVNYGVTAQPES